MTGQDLKNYIEHCRTTDFKAIRFGGVLFKPEALAKACEEIYNKCTWASAGLDQLSAADIIFLELLKENIS